MRLIALFLLVPAVGVSAERPNVVLILSDDQAWGDYGFMGHPAIETPRLDRLAAESLTFTRGYVPSSLCAPSLASIITGLYPRQHGYIGNDPQPTAGKRPKIGADPEYDARRERLIAKADGWATLPRRLAPAGYLSQQTGKWWLGSYRRGGFTHGMTRGFPKPGGRHGDDGLTIGREGLGPIPSFLDQTIKANRPFFLWYAPFMPHTPHTPPQRFLDKYRDRAPTLPIAKYWAMCEWFDETCGKLLDELEERGLSDNTIVVYACDNGWINLPDRSAYDPKSKRSPYDAGLRTPIMVRWPGQIEPRRDENTLVSTIDIAPTVLAATGLEADPGLPGIDLRDQAALAARDGVQGAVYEHDIVDLDAPVASLRWRWGIRDRWKLIVPFGPRLHDAKPELYDVLADPTEQQDLAGERTAVVGQLQAELDAWWTPAPVTAAIPR